MTQDKNQPPYRANILSLFRLLSEVDKADREPLQWHHDDDQLGYYGHIRAALISIAGSAIVDHWDETGEIEYLLADRS